MRDLGVRLAFLATAAICISAVPFLYALLLLIQLPLVASGLTPFHAHVYFVRSLYGALSGAAIGFLGFRERAESMAEEILPNLGKPGYRLRWGELFDLSLPNTSLKIGIVLLVPCLFVLPGTAASLVAAGVIWGIVMGLVEVLITLRVDNQALRRGWARVGFVEIMLGIAIVIDLGYYWIDRQQFRWFMEFFPTAAFSCAATYGLVHLTTIAMARQGVPAWPLLKGSVEMPGAATSATTAALNGGVLGRMGNAIRGYLDRNEVRIQLSTGEEVYLDGPVVEPILAALRAQTAQAAKGVRRALIVATGEYEDPALARLRGPTKDADTLARVLGDPATGGFEVDLLTDGDGPTARQRISAFFAERGQDDLLMLHISGHIIADGDGRLHLAVRDTELAALDGTGVAVSFVRDQLDQTGSRRVVLILDCCYSEALAPGTPAPTDHVVHVGEAFGAGAGRTVLTATSTSEYTFEGTELRWSQPQPSTFTTALANGLATGKADLDGNGEITVDELYDYASELMHRHAPDQKPMKWSDGADGRTPVARSTQATSRSAD